MELIEERRKILLNTPHIQTSTSSNFSTDIVAPLKGLEIEFEPIQSGSGTPAPDNVRPIDGRQQVSVRHFGKNLFDKTSVTPSSMTCYTSSGDPVTRSGIEYYLPAGTYTLKCHSETVYTYVYINVLDTNGNFVSFASLSMGAAAGWRKVTITLTEGQYLLIFKGTTTILDLNMNLQIELGTEATNYEVFQGNKYSVTFPAIGKNLFDEANANWTQNKFINASGVVTDNTAYKYTTDLIEVKPSTTYYIQEQKNTSASSAITVPLYDVDGNFISRSIPFSAASGTGVKGGSFTTTAKTRFIRFSLDKAATNVMLEQSTTRSDYEPYTNTVYGGTLDLVTGVLTIIHNIVVIDGSENPAIFPWQPNNVASGWIKALYRRLPYENIHPNYHSTPVGYYCDKAKPMTIPELRTLSEYGFGAYDNNSYGIILLMKIEDVGNTLESLNAYLTQNPFTIVYPLLNPVTYQLTPTQIKALLNGNTFLTDDGKIAKVNYWKHMK